MEYRATLSKEGRRTLIAFEDCPGCVTFSDRSADVPARARDALEGWLEAHLVTGDVPPMPSRVARKLRRAELAVRISPLLAVRLQIRWARRERSLSQGDLGKLLGVSRQQIALLEAPDGNPTIRTLERAAAALGLELAIELRSPRAA